MILLFSTVYIVTLPYLFNFITEEIQKESKKTSKKRKRTSPGNQINEEATQVPKRKYLMDSQPTKLYTNAIFFN